MHSGVNTRFTSPDYCRLCRYVGAISWVCEHVGPCQPPRKAQVTIMWVVKLVAKPTQNDFRDGYFPRKLRYKADAETLKKEVESKGGKAVVEKAPKK